MISYMNNKTNLQDCPFLQDVGTDQGYSPRDNESWMKFHHKDKMTKMLTGCFRKVMDDWNPHESCRVVTAIERLLFRSIDMDLLMKDHFFKEGTTFSFNVMEDVESDDLFDLLLDYHTDKWIYIQDEFSRNGTVDLVYEDRFLQTPLSCLMLAQFIRRMKFQFHLNYRSIRIFFSKKDFHVVHDDETLKIWQQFSYQENRTKFLTLCLNTLVGQPFELIDRNNKHTRSLRVSNGDYELSIHPEGGIAYGWELIGKESDLTIEDLPHDLEINIPCFNRLSHSKDRKGIPYMVEFQPVLNEEIHKESSSL